MVKGNAANVSSCNAIQPRYCQPSSAITDNSDTLDVGAKRIKACLYVLIATVYLRNIVYAAGAVGAQGSD